MTRNLVARCLCALVLACPALSGWCEPDPVVRQPWIEARTVHFRAYSCGRTQEVAKLVARLEQFNQAYSALAGAQAVASPPIVVLAFPDHEAMRPFMPQYHGRPGNLAGFFRRGTDENLIVLPLRGTLNGSLEIIFHEYAHLLLRHNQQVWPMWLNEGMADIYATFEVAGAHTVRIGRPMELHLNRLGQEPLMPLANLFAVSHDSPEYNEQERQGLFYAQSWLLTHYLMLGNSSHKARFGQMTTLLRQGQDLTQAFTNTFRTTLTGMDGELKAYLQRGVFRSAPLTVNADLSAPRALAVRPLEPAEVCCRLGDELMRIDRLGTAESYFLHARSLAPDSPLPYEGLGLLAAERNQSRRAVQDLREALDRGSDNFLAHYTYAREMFHLTARSPGTYARVEGDEAREIRAELRKAVSLMPDFGPGQHLLGFFELVQGEDYAAAEVHLQRAIQLEPENLAYGLSLAQVQIARQDLEAARGTLESLCRPYVPFKLRSSAQQLLSKIR